jgi:hypothetical protein
VIDPLDICPTCKAGRLKEDGVVSLPNECCAAYFFGEHSPERAQWREFVRWYGNYAQPVYVVNRHRIMAETMPLPERLPEEAPLEVRCKEFEPGDGWRCRLVADHSGPHETMPIRWTT